MPPCARPPPKPAATVFFSEATTAALGKLLDDPSPSARNAAYRGLGLYANWRSPAARQILIQRAADKTLDSVARIDAADGFTQAVKLQASGVQQDPPMFRALVGLLSDVNEELRTVAFLALAPIREYMLGSSNGGQFPPPGGWQKWLEKSPRNRKAIWSTTACVGRQAATPAYSRWTGSARAARS